MLTTAGLIALWSNIIMAGGSAELLYSSQLVYVIAMQTLYVFVCNINNQVKCVHVRVYLKNTLHV